MTFGVPLNPSLASYYSNVSGFIHGPVDMHNLTTFLNSSSTFTPSPLAAAQQPSTEIPFSVAPPIWARLAPAFLSNFNATDAHERIGTWNWSAPSELAFRVLEKRPVVNADGNKGKKTTDMPRMNASLWSDISLMHGRVELTDKDSGEELAFDMEAVHFVTNGTLYGFAEPAGYELFFSNANETEQFITFTRRRHVDVRHLPSLVPTQYANATAQAVNAELIARIRRLQDVVNSGSLEIESQSTGMSDTEMENNS